MKISRFLVFIVIFSLLFSYVAFADDLEPVDTGSSSSTNEYVTEEHYKQLDDEIKQLSVDYYNLLSDNGTKASTYDTTDIYNWLNNHFGVNFGNYGSTWQNLTYTRLEQIRSAIQGMSNVVTGWDLSIINASNCLTDILMYMQDLGLNPDYAQTGISIYDLIHSIVTSLTTIDPNDGDLSVIETMVYMYEELQSVNTNLSSILNSSYSIDAKLVNIHNYLINFRNDVNTALNTINSSINTGFTNVNANMATIISRLQSMQNDYNNVVWSPLNSYDIYNGNNDSVISATSTYNNIYFRFSHSIYNDSIVYKITLPVISYIPNRFDKIFDISITVGSTTIDKFSYNYEFDSYGKLTLYISDLSFNNILYSSIPTIHIQPTNPAYFYIQSDYKAHVSFIDSNNIDFYTVYNWLHNRNVNNIYQKFEMLYASDDLIKAKENQQDYEDNVIGDFTGDGEASAKLSDAISAKDTSKAIKNGLSTGASSAKALGAFDYNNPAGLYIWFTQDVANWFTVYTPNRRLMSSNPYSDIQWTDSTTDVLTELDHQYYEGLEYAH